MNVLLIGYGKMGREIEKILVAKGHTVVHIIDESNAADLNLDNLRTIGADVAIEFTTPDSAFENIRTCIGAGIPVVCGTTGWLDRYDEIVELCREDFGALFYATNFSIGVNIFFRLNELLAHMMDTFPEYDVRMEEIHHVHKKDAPSGTAITLANGITSHTGRKSGWTMAKPDPDEIFIAAGRSGEVPGTHTVEWDSETDSIVIIHEAKNRQGLAKGVVMAAEFLRGKTGVYSMEDMLGL